MRDFIGIIGIVAAVQGALGYCGLRFDDRAWGALHQWFELSSGQYAALGVAGLVLAVWGETGRRHRKA